MPSIIKNGVVVGTCDYMPDVDDLAERGETAIGETGAVGQLWDGEVFSDPVLPDEVPQLATKLALYNALKASGDWPAIASAMAADEDANNTWMFASIIERGHPMIEQFRLLLGWTEQQVDGLFRAAQ